MEHFSSFKDYRNFALAREFIYSGIDKGKYHHVPNKLERWGGRLIAPLFAPADKVIRNIRNPLMIAAITVSGVFLATLLFYPSVFAVLAGCAFAIKLTTFALLQTTILGIGLRTFGRLSSSELLKAWNNHELIPVPVGAEFY